MSTLTTQQHQLPPDRKKSLVLLVGAKSTESSRLIQHFPTLVTRCGEENHVVAVSPLGVAVPVAPIVLSEVTSTLSDDQREPWQSVVVVVSVSAVHRDTLNDARHLWPKWIARTKETLASATPQDRWRYVYVLSRLDLVKHDTVVEAGLGVVHPDEVCALASQQDSEVCFVSTRLGVGLDRVWSAVARLAVGERRASPTPLPSRLRDVYNRTVDMGLASYELAHQGRLLHPDSSPFVGYLRGVVATLSLNNVPLEEQLCRFGVVREARAAVDLFVCWHNAAVGCHALSREEEFEFYRTIEAPYVRHLLEITMHVNESMTETLRGDLEVTLSGTSAVDIITGHELDHLGQVGEELARTLEDLEDDEFHMSSQLECITRERREVKQKLRDAGIMLKSLQRSVAFEANRNADVVATVTELQNELRALNSEHKKLMKRAMGPAPPPNPLDVCLTYYQAIQLLDRRTVGYLGEAQSLATELELLRLEQLEVGLEMASWMHRRQQLKDVFDDARGAGGDNNNNGKKSNNNINRLASFRDMLHVIYERDVALAQRTRRWTSPSKPL
eukprot:PhM_4_TR10270/c0_g1_i1/m.97190